MKSWINFSVELTSYLLLVVGCIIGYFSFFETMTLFMGELAIYALIGSIFMLFSSQSGNPGGLIFGAIFIIAIVLFTSSYVAIEIGDIKKTNISVDFMSFSEGAFKLALKKVWPLLVLLSGGLIFSFIKKKKTSEKLAGFGQDALYRILVLFGISALSLLLLYLLPVHNKAIVLIAIVVSRIGVEIFVYRKMLGLALKSTIHS